MAERQQAVQLQPCHCGKDGLQSQCRVTGDNRQIQSDGTLCQKPVQHIPAPEFRLDMEREWEHDTGDSSTTAGSGSGAAADGPLLIYPR